MRLFVTLHINWLIKGAFYYRNFKTRRERDYIYCKVRVAHATAFSREIAPRRTIKVLEYRPENIAFPRRSHRV